MGSDFTFPKEEEEEGRCKLPQRSPFPHDENNFVFHTPRFPSAHSPRRGIAPAAQRALPPHRRHQQTPRTIPRPATQLLPPPPLCSAARRGTGSSGSGAGPAEGGSHLRSAGTVTPRHAAGEQGRRRAPPSAGAPARAATLPYASPEPPALTPAQRLGLSPPAAEPSSPLCRRLQPVPRRPAAAAARPGTTGSAGRAAASGPAQRRPHSGGGAGGRAGGWRSGRERARAAAPPAPHGADSAPAPARPGGGGLASLAARPQLQTVPRRHLAGRAGGSRSRHGLRAVPAASS